MILPGGVDIIISMVRLSLFLINDESWILYVNWCHTGASLAQSPLGHRLERRSWSRRPCCVHRLDFSSIRPPKDYWAASSTCTAIALKSTPSLLSFITYPFNPCFSKKSSFSVWMNGRLLLRMTQMCKRLQVLLNKIWRRLDHSFLLSIIRTWRSHFHKILER